MFFTVATRVITLKCVLYELQKFKKKSFLVTFDHVGRSKVTRCGSKVTRQRG